MSEPDSYTSHNFDAVNDQIREIAAREKARTTAYRLDSYRTAFMYAGAAVLIVGLLALLLSWSYRLVNAPYPKEVTKVVKPEIIEKEVIKIIEVPVSANSDGKNSTSYQGPVASGESSNTSSSPNAVVVTNYSTFKHVTVDTLNLKQIVSTGWSYEDSNSTYPKRQFCYYNIGSQNSSTSLRVNLAEIEDGEYTSYVDNKLAREASTSQRNLKKLEENCEWAGS